MRGKVESFSLPAATEEGAKWMLKALHPAEPSIAGIAMPDGTSYDTVPIELSYTSTIGPATLGTIPSAWGADITLMPHPICPVTIIPTGGASPLAASIDMRVPMFSGVNFDNDFTVLGNIAEAWRLCALSVTCHLDATATTDSGTVAAAQQVSKPNLCCFGGGATLGHTHVPYVAYNTASDYPDYDQLMQLPRSYQANVRQGFYMPLKLTQTSQHWYSQRELMGLVHLGNMTYAGVSNGTWTLGTATTPAYPYYNLSPMKCSGGDQIGGTTPAMMGDNWGHASVIGLNPASSLVFKVKMVLELKVQCTSTYAPHLKPPPPRDAVALDNYFKIVRELADCYPADYNDGGKILKTISSVIKSISPYLSLIPGYGSLIGAAAGPVTGLLDYGASRLADRPQRKARKAQPAPMLVEVATPSPGKQIRTVRTKPRVQKRKTIRVRT